MQETNTPDEKPGPSATSPVHAPAKTAWTLGLGGLVPFVLLSALLAYGGRQTIGFDTVSLAFSAYSASILAFLGGIRWGVGLRPAAHQRHELILSVLPSIAGWLLVLVPAPYAFAGFAVCFALQGGWDLNSARRGKLPSWFARLRLVLTLVVVLCQIAVFVRTF
ncbi:DUF3429 domain-containing protein [Fulvimarina endophytica]|nr:DUF3429 domain-containing protein [Fulvimarina endophytica]